VRFDLSLSPSSWNPFGPSGASLSAQPQSSMAVKSDPILTHMRQHQEKESWLQFTSRRTWWIRTLKRKPPEIREEGHDPTGWDIILAYLVPNLYYALANLPISSHQPWLLVLKYCILTASKMGQLPSSATEILLQPVETKGTCI